MQTIYGFKRPDGSVVVDTHDTYEASARLRASAMYHEPWWSLKEKGYTILPFTLGPDGSITPKE